MASSHYLSPRLHQILGITAPIIQSGMGGVAGVDLASAVSNAGGLGNLAALRLRPDQVREAISEIRARTAKPFGVNMWLHEDVRTPPDADAVADEIVLGSQAVLNEFRPRFDLPTTVDRPTNAPDLVNSALEVMIEERVPVFSAALGVPEAELVERFHQVGTKTVAMVATIADAVEAANNGVDVIVAQGTEAGGHRSYGTKRDKAHAIGQSTLTLVPEIIDAVGNRVPVVAAGGITDGRGLAAMLALGADGVLLGTRFVATQESLASPVWKKRLTSGDRETTLTDGFSGQWARVLTSEFTEEWEDSGAQPPPGLMQSGLGKDLFRAAVNVDDDQFRPLYAGAGVALLNDIPPAASVVEQFVADAWAHLRRFQ